MAEPNHDGVDDLALEAELRAAAPEPAKAPSGPYWLLWVPAGLIFAGLAGGVAWLLMGSNAFTYKRDVDQVMAAPGSFGDRQLRVEGELRQGSIRFRQEPCEWRFVLTKGDTAMPVRFPQCVVPDTFRDGMGISVIVQGHIGGDGTFLANQVVPRCPSKYEMQQRQQNGEATPHSLAPPFPES